MGGGDGDGCARATHPPPGPSGGRRLRHLRLHGGQVLQGECLGGGFEAALSSDVIVAEKGARFGFPEILFNLFPGFFDLFGGGCTEVVTSTFDITVTNHGSQPTQFFLVDFLSESMLPFFNGDFDAFATGSAQCPLGTVFITEAASKSAGNGGGIGFNEIFWTCTLNGGQSSTVQVTVSLASWLDMVMVWARVTMVIKD